MENKSDGDGCDEETEINIEVARLLLTLLDTLSSEVLVDTAASEEPMSLENTTKAESKDIKSGEEEIPRIEHVSLRSITPEEFLEDVTPEVDSPEHVPPQAVATELVTPADVKLIEGPLLTIPGPSLKPVDVKEQNCCQSIGSTDHKLLGEADVAENSESDNIPPNHCLTAKSEPIEKNTDDMASMPVESEYLQETQQDSSSIIDAKEDEELFCQIVDIKTMDASDVEDEKFGAKTTLTRSSTPVFDLSSASYNYASVPASPMEIDVLDYDLNDKDKTADVECDSLVSHCEPENEIEDGLQGYSTLPSVSDQFKLYKVVHKEETFFLKSEKAQCDVGQCIVDPDNKSLQQCLGCEFRMQDPTAPHYCSPDFCTTCQSAVSNYELHKLESHATNLTTCPFCQENKSSLQNLEEHLLNHTLIKLKPSVCIGCKSSFKTLEGRLQHLCCVIMCKTCNLVYNSEEKLLQHEKSQHKKLSVLTEVRAELDKAVESDCKMDVDSNDGETKNGKHICDFCDKRFASVGHLDLHIIWHLSAPAEKSDDVEIIEEFGKVSKIDEIGSFETLRCPHCTLNLAGTKALDEHLICSNFCKHCLKQYGDSHSFESHMVEYHCDEKQCQFCDAQFEDSRQLINHAKRHTRLELRLFRCKTCERRFGKEDECSNHKCQGRGKQSKHVCKDCRIYFQCENTRDMHLRDHHAQAQNCPICKFTAESLPQLLDHVKSHFGPTSQLHVVCGKCMMHFDNDEAFYGHCCGLGFKGFKVEDEEIMEFSSDTEQIVACHICGKDFLTEESLEEHVKDVVSDATKIAKEKLCKCCNVVFAVRSSFEAHVIQNHLSSLQCGFCHKYFASRRAMEQHLLHHTNIHRHPRYCHSCSKIYFSAGLYENHSCESANEEEEELQIKGVIPINEPVDQMPRKLYYCPVCSKGFKGKRYLEDVHIPMHTEKFFTCNICQRQLQKVETLQQHLLCHAEAARAKTSPAKDKQLLPMLVLPQISVPEEKNRCFPCRRVFPNEAEFKKHEIVHNYSAKVMNETDRKISCKFCLKKFESEQWLLQHFGDKHNIMSGLRYPCNLCNISFSSVKDRAKHLCLKNDDNDYEIFWERVVEVKDEPVQEKFKFDQAAMDHPCTHCGDNFTNPIALISHQIYERYCPECRIKFSDIDVYQQHRMYEHVSLDYCTFCRQMMKNRVMLIKHLRTHHTNLPLRAAESIQGYIYRCRNCKDVFKVKSQYDQHNLEKHYVNKKLCPFCHEEFGSHRELVSHSKVHCHVKKQTSKAKTTQKLVKATVKPPKLKQSPAAPAGEQPPTKTVRGQPYKIKPTEKPKLPPPEIQKDKRSKAAASLSSKKSSDSASVASSSKTVVPTEKADFVRLKRNWCSGCRAYMPTTKDFYEHVVKAHFNNPRQCPFCPKKGNLPSHITLHLKFHKNAMCVEEPSQPARSETLPAKSPAAQLKAPMKKMDKAPSQSHEVSESTSAEKHKCPVCSQLYNNQTMLDGHIRTCHHLEPAKAQLLQKAVLKASPEKDRPGPDKKTFCRHCHTSFEAHAQLRAHAVKAKVFCEFCEDTFADTKEHEMHMLEEHPMDDTCQFCGAYIPDRAGLVIHIRKHTSVGPIMYKCFGCNNMYTSSKEKEKHPCVAYACPKCNVPQKGPDGLEEHLLVAHNCPEPKTTAKPIKSSRGRQRQPSIRGESSAIYAEPEEPPKKKPRSNSSHSSTRQSDSKRLSSNYNCEHCLGLFASQDSLVRHAIQMKIYCKHCKGLFASVPAKEAHTCHASENSKQSTQQPPANIPFVCRCCGEHFTSYQVYEKHSRTHDFYQCKACFKVFDSFQQLKQHEANAHERPLIKLESDSDDDIFIVEEEKTSKKPAGQYVLS